MGKLKSLFVNHGEKVGMALVAVIVMAGLAGAKWSPYTGTAGQITTKVTESENRWVPAQWPAEEAEKFKLTEKDDPNVIIRERLQESLPITEFTLSQKLKRSPHEQTEPIRNPEWAALEDPIATAGRVLLAVVDEKAIKDAENQQFDQNGMPLRPGQTAPAEDDTPDDFKSRGNLGGGLTGGLPGADAGMLSPGMGPGYDPAAMQPATGSGRRPTTGRGRRGGAGGAAGPAGAAEAMPGAGLLSGEPGAMGMGMGMGGMMGGMGASLPYGQTGRGFHYVSVRAVFPVREQISKIAQATNLQLQQAASSFEILDFEIERQTRQESGDPWGGPWEPVDIEVSRDVLSRISVGLEPDIVFAQVTDPAMTMPLPTRVSGVWRSAVTHPRIEKFQLTEKQIEQEATFQIEALKKLEEMKKELPPPPASKRGFADIAPNAMSLTGAMFGGSGNVMGDMYGGGGGYSMPEMSGAGGAGAGAYNSGPTFGGGRPGGNRPAPKLKPIEELLKMKDKERLADIKDYIEKVVNVVGELMLFRYIDFSVEPGKTYRYRARLVFRNPNFNKNVDEAAGDTTVVSGETRLSDWSAPTAPTTVPKDHQYFVTDVKTQMGRTFPLPQLDVFQWDTSLGTLQQAILDLNLGQTISGKKKTAVLDPVKGEFEDKDYQFLSNDYVIDAIADISLDQAAHSDLKPAGGSTGGLMLPELVLVSLSEGGMKVLDPSRQAKEQSTQHSNLTAQNKQWKEMKERSTSTTDMLGAGGGAEMMGMDAEMMGMQPRRRSVLPRQQRGAGAAGRGGPAGMMMP